MRTRWTSRCWGTLVSPALLYTLTVGDTFASQASPAPLFALGHSDDRATSNTWTTREMLGGDPAGLYGSAVAAFTYPVPDTANNPNLTNSSHEVVLEMGQASGIYVYGGFEMSLANSTTARATISSSFHVLKKAPGGAEPSWFVWAPDGSPGPRAMHSMTWATVAYTTETDQLWSISNPYALMPCNLSMNTTACVSRSAADAYENMKVSIISARIVLFGGVTSTGILSATNPQPEFTVLNTTNVFDFNRSRWAASASSIAPPARWGHVACRRSFSTMLVFGGMSVFTNRDLATALAFDSSHTRAALDDTWLYNILDDQWVGPLALQPPAAAPDCIGCAAQGPPSLGRVMAASTRVGSVWYVFGGATTGANSASGGAASVDNIAVLWSLDLADIDEATGVSSSGWRYYRLSGHPAVVVTLTGSVLDVASSNFSALSGVTGGVLFPGDFDGTVATPTTVLISCGGFLSNNGANFIDRPFMCFGLNIRNQSFEIVPPSVQAQNWEFTPAQLSATDTVISPRIIRNPACGGADAFSIPNCSIVAYVVNDVNTVIFGGFHSYTALNEVSQFFPGEVLTGRGVMTSTATEPTPTLKVSLYSAVSLADHNGTMVLWYLSTNSEGCGLSSCAPSLWHLTPASFYSVDDFNFADSSGVLDTEHSQPPPVWVDSGPDTTSNYALPSPVVNGIPFFAANPSRPQDSILIFAGSYAVELWTYTLVTRPCTNTSLTESLFQLFSAADHANASTLAEEYCTPIAKFLPGFFRKTGNIVEYASVPAVVSRFLKPVYAVVPDPTDAAHFCVVMVGQLNERWLNPPMNYSGTYVTANDVGAVRMDAAVYSSRTGRVVWQPPSSAIPSLRAYGTVVVLPDETGADTIVYIGGAVPHLGLRPTSTTATTLAVPDDAVWKAKVVVSGDSYSLEWTHLRVTGDPPTSGVWGAHCVVGPMVYVMTEVVFYVEPGFLFRQPILSRTGVQRGRLVGDEFHWGTRVHLPVDSAGGGTKGFHGWADLSNIFGYPVDNGSSVLLGVVGGTVGDGEQTSAAVLPTVLLTCVEGTSSLNFATQFCSPCPVGTFKSLPGSAQCTLCPTGTYSSDGGARTESECAICAPDYCGVRGKCSLSGFSPQCACDWGYSGSRCQVNGNLVTLYVIVGILFVIALARGGYRWARRPRKCHHVFISYRVASEAALARRVCRELQGLEVESGVRLNCYLDQKDIESGTDWEVSFMTGLARSCVYLPLISNTAIAPMEGVSVFDDKEDNLLKEFESALAMSTKGQIGVLPLLVGDLDPASGDYSRFVRFDVDRFPKGCSKTDRSRPVRETMRSLFKFQGIFTRPDGIDEETRDQILVFLQNKVWRTSNSGVSLGLRRYWVGDTLQEERSHEALQRIGTMAGAVRPTQSPSQPSKNKHSTANELWDTALTAALIDSSAEV